MTNTSIKTKTKPTKPVRPTPAPAATAPNELDAPRSRTKQDVVLGLLRRSEGATIPAIMDATGWQAHSVRGFLAGVVRKKLGLTLTSAVADDQRTYRVVTVQPKASSVRRKRVEAASIAAL